MSDTDLGWNGGDLNGDGSINSIDLGLLLNNFKMDISDLDDFLAQIYI